MTYKIMVRQLVPDEELDHDDRADSPVGEYEYVAESEDEALDDFHSEVPIACLEDFEIKCERV